MKKYFLKKKNQKGYAILFTIVIVSAVSVITAGLSNTAYKQVVLSSLANDSQTAFYQSDTASDCALYADRVEALKTLPDGVTRSNAITNGGSWSCGGVDLDVVVNSDGKGGYSIYPKPTVVDNSGPCFRIDVSKDKITYPLFIETTIIAKGYNFCDKTNPRTVEREIEIKYQEDVL